MYLIWANKGRTCRDSRGGSAGDPTPKGVDWWEIPPPGSGSAGNPTPRGWIGEGTPPPRGGLRGPYPQGSPVEKQVRGPDPTGVAGAALWSWGPTPKDPDFKLEKKVHVCEGILLFFGGGAVGRRHLVPQIRPPPQPWFLPPPPPGGVGVWFYPPNQINFLLTICASGTELLGFLVKVGSFGLVPTLCVRLLSGLRTLILDASDELLTYKRRERHTPDASLDQG